MIATKLLKEKLEEKLQKEFDEFGQEIVEENSPDEIFDRAYEIAVKEQIKDELNSRNLDDIELKALLKHNYIIAEVYDEWMNEDTRLGEILDNSIDNTIEFITEDYSKKMSKNRESR